MASTAVTSSPVAGAIMNDAGAKSGMTPSQVNSIRISAVMGRLSFYTLGHVVNDAKEFVNLSLSLARGIDFAVASHEVPDIAQKLPSQLKQICQCNSNNTQLQASIMVLMISVKNACQNGWFPDRDSEELMNLTNEIASIFGSFPNFNTEPSSSHPVISTIMSRFYPRLKMGHTLVFLEAKPGFDAYVNDFLISKNLKSAPGEKLRLFVVQTDSIETSSCLVSPPKVNFLLNGKAVERRTNAFMDTGPQIPTVVKQLLKYGSNLLQAIGEFNGNYIIAIALMSELPNPESNVLQDYVHCAPATLDSDPDIIEGPSRISLNCPISFTRIKTPVKGHSCNHIQCFDFDNYLDINSRRPSWRCPHCNQPVCFTDIRINQKMVKILKEVGPMVTDIVISSDWSWKTATVIDDSTQKPDHTNPNSVEDNSENRSLPSTPVDILDLTENDDFMDDIVTDEAEDTKINPNESSVPSMVAANPSNTSDVNANQSNNPPHMEDDFWSGIYMSTFGDGSLNVQPSPNYAASPFSPDSNMTSASMEAFHGNSIATAPVLSGRPNALQLQQYQFGGNPAFTNEYGRLPQLQPSNITRTPIAVQALPAVQMPPYSVPPQQRSRSNQNAYMQHNPSTVPQSSPVSPMNATVRSQPQVPHMSMPLNQHHSGLQPQRNPSPHPPNQGPHSYRTSNELHNSNQQQQQQQQHMANIRIPQAPVQSPGSMHHSPNFMRSQSQVGSYPIASQQAQFTSQQAQLVAAANMAVQMSLDPSRPVSTYSMNNNPVNGHRIPPPSQGEGQRVSVGASSQPVMRSDSYDPPDPNWRPTGRMRGALTGQAYSDALNQFIIRPNQQAQAQAARPPNHTQAGPATRPGT